MDETRPILKKYEGHFKSFGQIPQEELYKYLSQGSVFVYFSMDEGFGMALLEAMASGLPVICTANVGAKDAVREGVDGFILPIRDVNGLKEKILYLYEHTKICQEMGKQARAQAESNFTWNHYGQRAVQAYEGILKQ
jgi:glycosyltransferase involved in cell wall biosynthesis